MKIMSKIVKNLLMQFKIDSFTLYIVTLSIIFLYYKEKNDILNLELEKLILISLLKC